MSFLAWAVLLVTVATASLTDLRWNRIPNALTIPVFFVGLSLGAFESGWHGLQLALSGAAVGLAMLLPFYALGGMAAGDVKLMTAAGSLTGPVTAALGVGLTLIVGALIALVLLVLKRSSNMPLVVDSWVGVTTGAWRRTGFSDALKLRFPYAVAIALGVTTAALIQATK